MGNPDLLEKRDESEIAAKRIDKRFHSEIKHLLRSILIAFVQSSKALALSPTAT